MPPLRALYHSIRLSERIPMKASPTLADACPASYPSFQSTDHYRHATGTSPTPFDSSQRAHCNEGFPDPGGRLHGELPFLSVYRQL